MKRRNVSVVGFHEIRANDGGLTLETSALFKRIINSVDKTKLFFTTPSDAAPQFL